MYPKENPIRFEHVTDFFADYFPKLVGLPTHWHSYCEMDFICSGQAIHTLNGRQQLLSADDIVITSTSDFHSYAADEATAPAIINIKFSEEFLTAELRNVLHALNGHVYHITNELAPIIRNKMQCLLTDNQQPLEHLRHKNLLESILIDLGIMQQIHPRIHIIEKDPLTAAFVYLENHFREPLTLEQVSKIAAFSPSYFSTLFHERFGKTFQAYVLDRRLEWARLLIECTNSSITTICYEAGFTSVAYFGRAFKHKYGISPTTIRKHSKECNR